MRTTCFPAAGRHGLAACFPLLALLAVAGSVHAQRVGSGSPQVLIRDSAKMFDRGATQAAQMRLGVLAESHSIPIVIETIESLEGEPIDDVALRQARASGVRGGIFILAARRDRKLAVRVSEAFADRVPEAKRLAIRDAFIEGFKQEDFDRGLRLGVEEIGKALGTGRPIAGLLPGPTTTTTEVKPASDALVVRNQVRLTLAGARRIIAGAEAKAAEMKLKVNIAVVDDGGHMLAFERMDGARPASGYTATTKAVTAATFRAPTGPIPAGTTNPDPLLNLSLQNAALAGGGKITTLFGGVPVVVNEQVIAGVGVGGGTGEQDAVIARAGIDAFLAEVQASSEPSKEATPAEK